MITAVPTNDKGEQNGEARQFTPLEWAKLQSTSKKNIRWKEVGDSLKKKEKQLMPVSTMDAKSKDASKKEEFKS